MPQEKAATRKEVVQVKEGPQTAGIRIAFADPLGIPTDSPQVGEPLAVRISGARPEGRYLATVAGAQGEAISSSIRADRFGAAGPIVVWRSIGLRGGDASPAYESDREAQALQRLGGQTLHLELRDLDAPVKAGEGQAPSDRDRPVAASRSFQVAPFVSRPRRADAGDPGAVLPRSLAQAIAQGRSARPRPVPPPPCLRTERLARMAGRGLHVEVPVFDQAAWGRLVREDPMLPRSIDHIRDLLAALRRPKGAKAPPRPPRGVDDCQEEALSRALLGLSNPGLRPSDRDEVDELLDADLPSFENVHETAHFVLRWTSTSAHAPDNIADAAIVTETAGYLEEAWTQFNATFGRAPYVAPGAAKIEVLFYDLSGAIGSTSPNGPINLDSELWVTDPGVRRPTSAHELFHRVQYAFGYRTLWPAPPSPVGWFSEGTASWSEVFKWQRVSRSYKITDLFATPDTNLQNAGYAACPFWVFFQVRQQDVPGDNALLTLLQKFEATGNQYQACAETIDEDWPPNNVFGQIDTFFALFARERRIGAWRTGPTGGLYPTILGPDGATLSPTVAASDVNLGPASTQTVPGSVTSLGSDYIRLVLGPGTDGRTLSMGVAGSAGTDFTVTLVHERAGQFRKAVFPPGATTSWSGTEVINLSEADAIVVIVSGRAAGGGYTLTASVS
jgi:hypothetical protein